LNFSPNGLNFHNRRSATCGKQTLPTLPEPTVNVANGRIFLQVVNLNS